VHEHDGHRALADRGGDPLGRLGPYVATLLASSRSDGAISASPSGVITTGSAIPSAAAASSKRCPSGSSAMYQR